jgi:hypothetical protein
MPSRLLPAIPVATDLSSLIRAVNIMRDILRTVTTSLTVNNTYQSDPLPSFTILSTDFPEWKQTGTDTSTGFVFYKSQSGSDPTQRAYVQRIDAVAFTNQTIYDDNLFMWRLNKPLNSESGDTKGLQPFQEDFFERVVNVHWSLGLAVEFFDG